MLRDPFFQGFGRAPGLLGRACRRVWGGSVCGGWHLIALCKLGTGNPLEDEGCIWVWQGRAYTETNRNRYVTPPNELRAPLWRLSR